VQVSAVQFKPVKGEHAGSLARLTALADEAGADADLVVLPEMAATGYIFRSAGEIGRVAEPARGPTFEAWRGVCQRRGCWLVGGLPERDGDRLYNSALVIDPSGELVFTYRKTLLYEADRPWATPGNSGYRRFQTPHGSFGVGICMDLNDPRFVMWCWRSRLDVIAFPTNWIEEGIDVWPYWRDRVSGSGATLVAANTYGREEEVEFSGRSAILRGEQVLAAGERTGDQVLRASL
jgi:N-carbamoylputrescine amidase